MPAVLDLKAPGAHLKTETYMAPAAPHFTLLLCARYPTGIHRLQSFPRVIKCDTLVYEEKPVIRRRKALAGFLVHDHRSHL